MQGKRRNKINGLLATMRLTTIMEWIERLHIVMHWLAGKLL